MSKNLVGGMLVGRVGFGGSSQACPASYSAEDSMAASIVRLECEGDELRATAAMLQEQASILAEERDQARTELSEWQTLRLWGAEPPNIHDFIKGQQIRIYETQDMEKTCEQLERERNEAREIIDVIERDWKEKCIEADTMRQHYKSATLEIEKLIQERDEARAMLEGKWQEQDPPLVRMMNERDEAIAARKSSAAHWLNQVEQANARVSRALQQVARAEQDRDEGRAELEMWRDANILHEIHRDELEKVERERNEAIQERERWKMQAMQKWGMRRELEELLGAKDTESEEQFAKGLAVLRDLIKERDEAREALHRITESDMRWSKKIARDALEGAK